MWPFYFWRDTCSLNCSHTWAPLGDLNRFAGAAETKRRGLNGSDNGNVSGHSSAGRKFAIKGPAVGENGFPACSWPLALGLQSLARLGLWGRHPSSAFVFTFTTASPLRAGLSSNSLRNNPAALDRDPLYSRMTSPELTTSPTALFPYKLTSRVSRGENLIIGFGGHG